MATWTDRDDDTERFASDAEAAIEFARERMARFGWDPNRTYPPEFIPDTFICPSCRKRIVRGVGHGDSCDGEHYAPAGFIEEEIF